MKILSAPDKFRGSLEADEVCEAISQGILLAFPDAQVHSFPLADGGEGTARILTRLAGGKSVSAIVDDPLRRPVKAEYGISSDGTTAFIEMAAASGLALLSHTERNPLLTTTSGTGQLILDALDKGVKRIILGIGGSATTDAGIGMASALGFEFRDEKGDLVEPVGKNLPQIRSIHTQHADPRIHDLDIVVACDVTNPLYGSQGAAYVYAPQKGADEEMVELLDQGLRDFSKIASQTFDADVSQVPGAGAAGGLGAGCLWFLNATLKDGVSIVIEQSGLKEIISTSDLVITGEGKVDEQTLQGKVVKGLADVCRDQNVPLAVVCGTLQITPEQVRAAGITCAVSVLTRPMSLETAETQAFSLVKDATFNLVRLFFFRRQARVQE